MINEGNIALIPARSGSKGLLNKCLRELNGRPLIVYTIEAAIASGSFQSIIVSSDSQEICDIATGYGIDIIHRPEQYAADDTPMSVVVKHAIETSNLRGNSRLTLLQPTSPLRTGEHIKEALSLFSIHVRGVYSVLGPTKKPWKAFVETENGFIRGLAGREYPFLNRQDLSNAYYPNGAIYSFLISAFLESRYGFDIEGIVPYLMKAEDSIDIDTYEDLLTVEKRLKEREYVNV